MHQPRSHETAKNYEIKHFMFGLMGGFYYSDHFKPWIIRAWIYTNIICLIINLGTCISYLILMKDVDLSTTYYTLCLIDGTLYSSIFVPLYTYSFRNELDMILKLNTNVRENENVRSLKRKIHRMVFYMMGLITLIFLVHNLFLLIVDNEEEYTTDVRSYNIPPPWVKKLRTKWHYICNSVFYFFPISLMASSSAASPIFVLFISGEFYHSASILCDHIRRFSGNSLNTFEILTEQCLNGNEKSNRKFLNFRRDIEVEREKLMENTKAAALDFQRLLRLLHIKQYFIT